LFWIGRWGQYVIARTVAPDGLPRPTGDEGHVLLDMIWAHHTGHHVWPTFGDLDRKLYASGLEFEAVVQQLCPALIRGLDPNVSRTPQDTQQLSLTIAGAANSTGAGPALSAFLVMVRTAATIEPHYRPQTPGERPVLRPQDLVGEPGIDPKLLTKEAVYAAVLLAGHEPCFGGGGGSVDDWTLNYDRGIRPFAGVTRLAEYWRIRETVVGPQRAEADRRPFTTRQTEVVIYPPLFAAPVVAVEPQTGSMEITCSLHPLIAEVAAKRFESGHYVDAVSRAFQAVEYRVQTLIGSKQIGVPLMGDALAKPAEPQFLTVTRSTGASLQSEREGMQFLFKGAMGALRNPRMHGPDDADTHDEAQEMLAFASFLMRRLDIEDEKRKAATSGP
jgi:uncharacterized protein (TIGR02391 family)